MIERLKKIDEKLLILLKEGRNNEDLVSEKREIMKKLKQLKND